MNFSTTLEERQPALYATITAPGTLEVSLQEGVGEAGPWF